MTTTVEFITALFYEVDEQLGAIPKHPAAHLWPNSVRLNFCMAAELSDATGRYGRSTPFHWPTR